MPSNLLNKIRRKLNLLKHASWDDVLRKESAKLYAGNLSEELPQFVTHYGLALNPSSGRDIRHDMRDALPVPDNSIAVFQSEDVFEHIQYEKLGRIFDEVYRVLKPNGLFRLSVPDYRCPVLFDRSVKSGDGKLLFDPGGGGRFENGRVVDGGHIWFPVYETVKALFDASPFTNVQYLHYTGQDGESVLKPIDYSLGYIQRTPDNDERVTSPRIVMSIVVDAWKLP